MRFRSRRQRINGRMDRITERTYPVRKEWVAVQVVASGLRALAILLIVMLPWRVVAAGGSASLIWWLVLAAFVLLPAGGSLALVFWVANFRYSLEEKFFVVEQGIIAKQKRYIPYSAFQNVLVIRSVTDMLFGFASLRIENASGGGVAAMPVQIPGLSIGDAAALRDALMQNVKSSAHLDQSGL